MEVICLLGSVFCLILLFGNIIDADWKDPDFWPIFQDTGGPFLVMFAFLYEYIRLRKMRKAKNQER